MQPYMLKPNGEVFDEIRNFFCDGRWAYSVYTDGVDYEGFWEQPEGQLKEACKKWLGPHEVQGFWFRGVRCAAVALFSVSG